MRVNWPLIVAVVFIAGVMTVLQWRIGMRSTTDMPASYKIGIVENGIGIIDVPSDRPELKREYATIIPGGFLLKATAKWFLGSRNWNYAVLEQKDGKRIVFFMNNVASEILDRDLYPLVQKEVDNMIALDKAYVASNPSEFTDKTGTVWRAVK